MPEAIPRPAWADIDLGAVRRNVARIGEKLQDGTQFMAVVKANAYGHGLVPTARALSGADAFGVARLPEAMGLRAAGLAHPIVLLEGVFSRDDLDTVAAHHFEIVIHSFEQLATLEAWHGPRPLRVWLKMDTGMNRLGFRISDFELALKRLRACKSLRDPPRLMTHLACADERDKATTEQQIKAFRSRVDSLGLERSIANSAGLLAWPDARVEWVRPGIMLYGLSPFTSQCGAELGLQAAMTLTTQLIAIRPVAAGEEVGYGAIWRAARATRIGIAAIGYGDGYPRQIGSGSPVRVAAREYKIAGRVSMDMIAIDLGDAVEPRVGDAVTLWGPELPAERLAECAGTIAYELVCGISQRVTVEYR